MSGWLLRNARVLGFNGEGEDRDVRVRAGRIDATGPAGELDATGVETLDLRGALLTPGWVDTHTHFFELARRRAGVDLDGASGVEEVQSRLRAFAERLPAGQRWVGGGGWDPGRYGNDPRLHRRLLDEVFGDRPVALESRDFHTLWCSTSALEVAGVFDGREPPAGGEIGRDPDGTPDGFLMETAWDLIWAVRPPESPAVAEAWIQDTVAYAHSLGLTGIHCMEPTSTYEQYRRLAAADRLRLRICFHTPLADLDARIAEGAASYRPEDPWLRRGGVKIFGDGSLGSRSAWMHHPYPDGTHGWPLVEEAELEEAVLRAAAAGIAPAVHAIGDRTLGQALDVFSRLRRRPEGRDLLLRIEHAQCVPPEELDRLAALGVFCAVQPVHLEDDIALLESEWGPAALHAYPLRAMRDAGVALGQGSDAPVATLDPRAGLTMALARRDAAGRTWTPEQALTVEEALAGYTVDAARGGAWNGECGRIVPGAVADLTAVDDVRDGNPGDWAEAATRLTLVGGEIAYESLAS